ncbi:MAG: hypothetical protein ACRD7E_02960, partial [Bryobacteraceae bacterium]
RRKSPESINKKLLEKRIIGGLPLGRFYPELSNCMLLCATEMSRRDHMDQVKQAFQPGAGRSRKASGKPRFQQEEVLQQ